MKNEEWIAIKTNNRQYDGHFYYALSTTKTVCRPSCTSRTPNPKHISIFEDVETAINSGFRPCTRCKPQLKDWAGYKEDISKQVIDHINRHYKEPFSLQRMGEVLEKNPHYIHRSFKIVMGITPLQYQHSLRIKEAKQIMMRSVTSTLLDVALEVGYNDSSQFSVKFKEITGEAPSNYRKKLSYS